MAKEVCENCGRIQEIFGPKIVFTEVNGKLYCEDCVENARKNAGERIDNKNDDLTDSEMLSKMLVYSELTYKESVSQSNSLNFIKVVIIVGIVISILIAFLRGCSIM